MILKTPFKVHVRLVWWQTDLIDDPLRRMSINRWMDRFLNDVGQSQLEKHSFKKNGKKNPDNHCNESLTPTEIGAHHRGNQPQVQGSGRRGGRRR